jgi:superfamily II DNA or RNA helicase
MSSARNEILPVRGAVLRIGEGRGIVRSHLTGQDGRVNGLEVDTPNGPVRVPPEGLEPGYLIGQQVLLSGPQGDPIGVGTVLSLRDLSGFRQVLVQFSGSGDTRWVDWRLLVNAQPVENRIIARNVGSHEDHAERFRLQILARALRTWDSNTGAFGRLDIDPLPHQMDVARRVVSAPQARFLIADDVGLGKTIEVGLILHALEARNRCRRVLVICPASLTTQWKLEMRSKFGRHFEIYRRDFRPEYLSDMRAKDHVIVSLDLVKREPHLGIFEASGHWDMIIFDEAHKLGREEGEGKNLRHVLATRMSRLAHSVLMLTATPHQGKSARFSSLLELVRPDLRSEIRRLDMAPEVVGKIIIRNRKTRVTDAEGNLLFRGHDTKRFAVPPTREMSAAVSALNTYLREGYRASSTATDANLGRAIGFVMTTYRKLASSSLAAIERALERRLSRLRDDRMTGLTLEEGGEEDLAEAAEIGAGGAFFLRERDQVEEVLRRVVIAKGSDQKFETFRDRIVRPLVREGENLLVFTEYRATQEYLLSRLRAEYPDGGIALIHGGMSIDEKVEAMNRFNDRRARILISTEAGGEGLNLHHACHVMVNYDLPWNPSRLVQRIGRLYRYGQRRRVQVINLHAEDGFDNSALALMMDRVATIAQDMSHVDGVDQGALAADILGDLMSHIDMESILERAVSMRLEQTEEEIEAAIRLAQEARQVEADILDHAAAHQPRVSGGFEARHMVSFVRGASPHLGVAVRSVQHDGRTLELEIPEELVGVWPEFRRRRVVRLTTDHQRLAEDKDLVPMDFETGFVRRLSDLALSRSPFDGLYAETSRSGSGLLSVHQVRWQSLSGEILEEELIPLILNGELVEEMAHEAFAELLLNPLPSARPGAPVPSDAERVRTIFRGVDTALRRRAGAEVMPGAVVMAGALRFGP